MGAAEVSPLVAYLASADSTITTDKPWTIDSLRPDLS